MVQKDFSNRITGVSGGGFVRPLDFIDEKLYLLWKAAFYVPSDINFTICPIRRGNFCLLEFYDFNFVSHVR